MNICILLSAYNGEKYLEEQLESLIKQEGVECHILVRDDGSTDTTHQILNKWQEKGLLRWYKGENLGFAMSFMDLVKNAGDYDYYAFCDQDDIWLPDKMKRAVEQLSRVEHNIKLYCSNVYCYKAGKTYGGIHKTAPVFDKYTCLLRAITPGCSMVFSAGLKKLLAENLPERIIAHDFWVYQTAMLLGEVVYDFEPTMLYRQHENNQIGQKVSKVEIWKRRIKSIFCSTGKPDRLLQAKELLRCFSSIMDEEGNKAVSEVACFKDSFVKRMKLFFDARYTMGAFKNNFWLRLRILCGKL